MGERDERDRWRQKVGGLRRRHKDARKRSEGGGNKLQRWRKQDSSGKGLGMMYDEGEIKVWKGK